MSINSNYQKGQFIDSSLRTSEVFLALFTGDPTAAGSGPECNSGNYTGYARQSMGATPTTAWTAVDGNGRTHNGSTVMFPAKGNAGTVTVTHFGIFTASSGGNLRFYGPLDASKTLSQGDVIGLMASNLEFEF